MKLPFRINTPVRITSAFGPRIDPITHEAGVPHDGFDLVSDGDRTVCAVVGGKVVQSRIITDLSNHTSEWGNYITIWGDDGHYHYYCHLAQRAVEAGATVKAGDPIGVMGSTGKSTGPHLHYEVRLGDGWTPICPSEILGIPNIASQTVYIVKPEFDEPAVPAVEDKPATTQLDNTPHEWAKDAVEWAKNKGILRGNERGDLRLSDPLTREEAVVMLHRLATL